MRAKCSRKNLGSPFSTRKVSIISNSPFINRAFSSVSAHSSPAAESHTTALPEWNLNRSRPERRCNMRIGTLHTVSSGDTSRIAPQYTPRSPASNDSIMCIVESLGAPVTEPHGKIFLKISASPTPRESVAETVEVIWWTVGRLSTSNIFSTSTLPGSQTRLRSLRMRSTIMRFSARFLGSEESSAARRASARGSGRRAAVPFMGFAVILRPLTRKNSSGENDRTVLQRFDMNAEYAAFWRGRSASKSAKSSGNSASKSEG